MCCNESVTKCLECQVSRYLVGHDSCERNRIVWDQRIELLPATSTYGTRRYHADTGYSIDALVPAFLSVVERPQWSVLSLPGVA